MGPTYIPESRKRRFRSAYIFSLRVKGVVVFHVAVVKSFKEKELGANRESEVLGELDGLVDTFLSS